MENADYNFMETLSSDFNKIVFMFFLTVIGEQFVEAEIVEIVVVETRNGV